MTLRQTLEYCENHPLTSTHHREGCIKSRKKWMEHASAFLKAHPDCCDHCWGWGTVEACDNLAPHGSGMVWNCYTNEPCGYCELEGRCAVCGQETVDEDGERECGCAVDGCDPIPECDCWLTLLPYDDEGVE